MKRASGGNPSNDKWEEAEKLVSELPSFVFFADEQDTADSMLFGGYLIHREKLYHLDQGVAEAKTSVGLPPDAPVKWSPPETPSYKALRDLARPKRKVFVQKMLTLLEPLEASCFFSLVWKYDRSYTSDAYKWAFTNVLQRLAITVERKVKARPKPDVWYPVLDVVVDWFPQPAKCKEYFGIYNQAFRQGYKFPRNKIRALKNYHACPCLLVTSCEFSPALQLADYCVASIGALLRWAYKRDRGPEEVQRMVRPVARRLLRHRGKVIGYGLVLPTSGQSRAKVREALSDLDLA